MNPYSQLRREAAFTRKELAEILAQLYALRNRLACALSACGHLTAALAAAEDSHAQVNYTTQAVEVTNDVERAFHD